MVNEHITFEEFMATNKNKYPFFNRELFDRVKNMSWDEFVARREMRQQKLDILVDSMETKPNAME
jgi:hypothetical protein